MRAEILRLVYDHPAQTTKVYAEAIGANESSVGRTLRSLADEGLLLKSEKKTNGAFTYSVTLSGITHIFKK